MSRSNGPPNQPPAWPTSRPQQPGQPGSAPQGQGYDAYDPYYTQAPTPQPAHQPAPPTHPRAAAQSPYSTAQQPIAPQPTAPPARQPRIQAPAASPPARSPQHGLPPSAYAPQQPQAYVPPSQPVPSPQGYTAPAYAPPFPSQPDLRFAPPSPYDAQPTQGYRQPAPQQPFHPGPSFDGSGQGGSTQQPQARQSSPPQAAWPAPSVNDFDAQGYNLDSYAPSQNSARPGDLVATPRTAPPAWTPTAAEGYGDPRTQPTRPPQRDVPNYAEAPAFAPPAYGQPTQAQALEPAHDDAEYDDTLEEEAPRRRWGLIAASLVGAIALGGGLAYAYKTFVAPPVQVAGPPTVKAGLSPVKVKPAEPGGTKFPNTDSKLMDSLSGAQATATENGARPVQTMRVSRDGSIEAGGPATPPGPPVAAASPPQQAAAASLAAAPTVPGMILVSPPGAAAPAPAAPKPQAQAPTTNQAAPAAPKAAAPKVIAAAPPAAIDAVEAAAGQVKKVAVPLKRPPPAAVNAPGAGGNGFVAVLASVPVSGSSRVAAMQQYADLQQKFGGALANKAPDVVEATTEKGPFHRLVVGPPASREAANSVCIQLKAAGYSKDCWVTAF